MPRYRKYVTVTAGSGTEVLTPALISTQAEPKRVAAVVSELSSSTVDLLVYVEREKIIDYQTNLLNTQEKIVDVVLDLPVGQQLYVGFRNRGTSAVSGAIGIIYEIGR